MRSLELQKKMRRTMIEKNKNIEQQANLLEGDIIREIFKNADTIARIHQAISSPRGDYYRRRLLQLFEAKTPLLVIEKQRSDAGIQESQRHINKLLELELIESDKDLSHIRTQRGEKAVNALRALETELGKESARKIFSNFLGPNSLRLFLRVYGSKKEIDFGNRKIKFNPTEIGKFSLFLPRSIEGIAAIDKLCNAELLTYKDNGNVYFDPRKARGFYKYLKSLYEIMTQREDK